jgi:hypothetical protein
VLKADETIAWNRTITSRFSLIPRQIRVLQQFTTYLPCKITRTQGCPRGSRRNSRKPSFDASSRPCWKEGLRFYSLWLYTVLTSTKVLQDKRLRKAKLSTIVSWLSGESVECRGFQNYSMQRLIHLLHFQRFLLTPEAYTRIRASTPPKSALKRLVNNMVARHWGSKTIDISTLKVICNGSRSLLHVLDFCASLL